MYMAGYINTSEGVKERGAGAVEAERGGEEEGEEGGERLPLDKADGQVRSRTEEDDHGEEDEGTLADGVLVETKSFDGLFTYK